MLKVVDGNEVDTKGFKGFVKKHIDSLKVNYNEKLSIIGDAALYVKETIEELHNKGVLFISRAPMKLKSAKAILKELKDEELKEIAFKLAFYYYQTINTDKSINPCTD